MSTETSFERPRSNVAPPNIRGPRLALSMREAVSIALARNFDITIAGFDPHIAESSVVRERSAFDPQAFVDTSISKSKLGSTNSAFNVTGGIRETDSLGIAAGIRQRLITGAEYSLILRNIRESTNSPQNVFDPSYQTSLTFTIEQPLFKNFGIDINQARIRVAMATKEQTLHDYRSQVIQTVDAVQQAYWNLVFSIENLQFRRKSLDLAKDLLRRNKIQVEVGTLAPIEITEAEATVASREEALLVAEREVKDREDSLKMLLNVAEKPSSWGISILPRDKPTFRNIRVDEMQLTLDALRKHAALENARLEIDKRQIDMKVAKQNLLPEFNLNASASNNALAESEGRAFEEQFKNERYSFSGGVSFRMPIGNRQANADYRQAQLRHAKTVATYHQTQQAIMEEVRRNARRVRVNVKRIEATRVARRLAEERLDAQEKKFKVGLSTSRDILEDQERLANSLTQETRALIDYHKSLASLDRATHSTLERFQIEMFYPGEAKAKTTTK
ncbi:MAG: TolC family protein [Nitrospinae bacterium]|nr:TolC family protein [Nitrospinota bacterium]